MKVVLKMDAQFLELIPLLYISQQPGGRFAEDMEHMQGILLVQDIQLQDNELLGKVDIRPLAYYILSNLK